MESKRAELTELAQIIFSKNGKLAAKDLVELIMDARACQVRAAKTRISEMKGLNIVNQGQDLKYTICTKNEDDDLPF